jgi:hypothetical protein
MPLGLGFFAAAGSTGGGLTPAYVHIATEVGTQSTFSFNSIPQIYTHLELRWTAKADYPTQVAGEFQMRFNGDTSSTYYSHWLRGDGRGSSAGVQNGSSGADSAIRLGQINGSTVSGQFASGICRITNYANTSVHKTALTLTGMNNSNSSNETERASLYSGFWGGSTAAITSISLFSGYSHITGTRVSLYGIRG